MRNFFLHTWALISVMACLSTFPSPVSAMPFLGNPANFNFQGPYCQNGPNAVPNGVSSQGMGQFSEATGNIVFVNTVTGEINVASSTPGTWSVKRVVGVDSAFRNVTILAADDPSFDYLVDTVCLGSANAMIPLVLGTSGGTFSASSAFIVIDSTTGEINLLNTPAGNYDITYTTDGQCPASAVVTLTVMTPPDPFFTYTVNQYCAMGTIFPDSISSPSVGVFHATPSIGLALDSTTGMIVLDSLQTGTYTIEYSIGGICPAQWQESFFVQEPFAGPLFDYVDTIFCRTDPIHSPILWGGTSVFFSSNNGLVFDSPTLGTIDPSINAVGTYLIQCLSSGICHETSTQTIHIRDTVQVTLLVSGDTLFAPGPGTGHQWYLNGNLITGANDSMYVTQVSGNYSVRYQRQGDECGTLGSLIYVGVKGENDWLASRHFYPNPSNGQVNFQLELLRPNNLVWELYDAFGKSVLSGEMNHARNFQGHLDLGAFPSGTYLLRITSGGGMITEKIVLMH